jgi:hypothetical protein
MYVLVLQAVGCAALGFVPHAGVFVAMGVIGFTAGLASAQLSGAFQRTIEPAYLGRTSSIVSLSDEAFMPIAMVAFGTLIGLTSIGLSCLVLGVGFGVLMVYSAARLR